MTISYETHPILAILAGYPFTSRSIRMCFHKEDITELTTEQVMSRLMSSCSDSHNTDNMIINNMRSKRTSAPVDGILSMLEYTFGEEFRGFKNSLFVYIGREQSKERKDDFIRACESYHSKYIKGTEDSLKYSIIMNGKPIENHFLCTIMYVDGKEKLYMSYNNKIGNYFCISMTERKFDLIAVRRLKPDGIAADHELCNFISQTILKGRSIEDCEREIDKVVNETYSGLYFLSKTTDIYWSTVIPPCCSIKIDNEVFKNSTTSYICKII